MLQKYKYYASIMPDAPDIVSCSKLCRHNPTDLGVCAGKRASGGMGGKMYNGCKAREKLYNR